MHERDDAWLSPGPCMSVYVRARERGRGEREKA